MEEQIKMLTEQLKALLNEDEFFEYEAKLCKKRFDAMKAQGFTDEQATEIVASSGSKVGG